MKSLCLTVLEFWLLPGCVLALCLWFFTALYYASHRPVVSDDACQWKVTTFAGAPRDAISAQNEVVGWFERQPDGDIWLRGMDTSVQGARDCLIRKGFTAAELRMISPR